MTTQKWLLYDDPDGARRGVLAPRLPKEEERALRLAYGPDRLCVFRLLKGGKVPKISKKTIFFHWLFW